MNDVMVSINMPAYNHEKYIRQAIESVLMQKVNFKYEIIIGEDCSPDHTREIVKEYEKKYPDIVKPIYHEKNVGVAKNGAEIREKCSGKYIACLEGDDYWTDENKLQLQFDFLENNPQYVAVYHNVTCVDKHGVPKKELQNYTIRPTHTITLQTILDNWECLPGQTASIFYRNFWKTADQKTKDAYNNCKTNGDMRLAPLLAGLGSIYYMENNMADHRRVLHEGTSWSATHHKKNLLLFAYHSKREIAKMMKQILGIDIDWRKYTKDYPGKALNLAIKKPTLTNLKIAHTLFWDCDCKAYTIKYVVKAILKKLRIIKGHESNDKSKI